MSVFEIPLSPRPQRLTIALAGVAYQLRFHYAESDGAGWLLDIATAAGTPLLCGCPLVTGTNLLAQYPYLGIAGALFVRTEDGAAPGFADLGVTAHVYFASN